jgi:COMPASS component SWD3
LWRYVEGRCIKTYQGHKNQKYSINACFGTYNSEDEDGETAAFAMCGDEEGRTMIWDVNTKKVLQVLTGHQGVVLGVDSSPDSVLVATCGMDGSIKVWENRPIWIEMIEREQYRVLDKEGAVERATLRGYRNGKSDVERI